MADSELMTLFAAAGFAAAADLAGLAQPALRLVATPADEQHLAAGTSKLGGTPDVPADFIWPTLNNIPMSLLAQINLADTAALAAGQPLPPAGMLAFFYDARQQVFGDKPTDTGGWAIRYFPHGQALQRATAPANLPDAARLRPAAIQWSAMLTLPQQPQLELPGLAWTAADQAKYDQFWAAFPTMAAHQGPQHQWLGYPDTLQDDMRLQCQMMTHGITDLQDPRLAGLQAGAQDWHLLLQIDSDARLGMQWGDGGILYCWMPRTALVAQQFDQSWLIIQTT